MTEPTPESLSIAHRYASGAAECAREIEQRVAAAVQEEREYCARVADNAAEDYQAMYVLEGFPEDLRRKGTAVRIATLIRKRADRPAPDGAIPTKDGDTTRCSTPSQEDTGSVSGERWRHKKRGTTYTIVGIANSQVVGEPIREGALAVVYRSEHDGSLWLRPVDEFYDGRFERLPPKDVSGPGSASNTDAAQEKAPEVSESYRALVKEMETNAGIFNRPMVDQMTKIEDEPTQTVAAPGPTAGDVERARSIIDDAANIVGGPEAGMLCKGIAVALCGERDSARASTRAELLAQIRGNLELRGVVAQALADSDGPHGWTWDENAEIALRALADKLTEAK